MLRLTHSSVTLRDHNARGLTLAQAAEGSPSVEHAKAWVILVSAGLLEIVWAIAFKYADGFRRPLPTAIGVVGAAASLYLLTRALEVLPVGTAYAVWMGIGAFGVAIVGMFAFGESASLLRLGCIVLILLGVAGLRAIES